MKQSTLYSVLKPLEENLKVAYKEGGRVSSELFRDLQIFEEYNEMTMPKMERYTYLSEKYKVCESLVRDTIKRMGKPFFLKKNLPLQLPQHNLNN